MADLIFVTGNSFKFSIGSSTCRSYGITIEQASPELDEVQSEDGEHIARRKAEAAFNLLQKPIVISDDSWAIPGLGGFPGPYMKSMNHWFSVEDFLRLTTHLTDRTIILSQLIVYQDESEQLLFRNDVSGTLLREPAGDTEVPITALVSLDGDNGKTIAEKDADSREQHVDRDAAKAWRAFAEWYKEHKL